MRKPTRYRGFMAFDMIFGLIIIGAVAVMLAGVNYRALSADAGLSLSRQATHLAEHAIFNLQHHQPLPVTAGDIHLTVRSLTTGTAPMGFIWAKVDASVSGRHEFLIGIVPAGSIQTSGGK
jgi:hypothetical protein